jgi:hypothetical protein
LDYQSLNVAVVAVTEFNVSLLGILSDQELCTGRFICSISSPLRTVFCSIAGLPLEQGCVSAICGNGNITRFKIRIVRQGSTTIIATCFNKVIEKLSRKSHTMLQYILFL